MEGLKHLLAAVYDNWTLILVCAGCMVIIYESVMKFMKKSREDKITIAKKVIKTTILAAVSSAEKDYEDWNKAGAIKRSQVISKIYEEWPILKTVINQEKLEEWIDKQIDIALDKLKEVPKDEE